MNKEFANTFNKIFEDFLTTISKVGGGQFNGVSFNRVQDKWAITILTEDRSIEECYTTTNKDLLALICEANRSLLKGLEKQ